MKLLLALSILLLSSCATQTLNVYKSKSLEPVDGQSTGYLLMVVGTNTTAHKMGTGLTTSLSFLKVGQKDSDLTISYKYFLSVTSKSIDYLDFKSTDYSGKLVLVKLPSGVYNFNSIKIEGNSPSLGRIISSSEKIIPIKFNVLSGKVTYIGRFITAGDSIKTLLGVEAQTGTGHVEHSFHENEDYELAQKLFLDDGIRLENIIRENSMFLYPPILVSGE